MYGSEIWGIACNAKLNTNPEELVQNKFFKWLLGVNKYCNNNEGKSAPPWPNPLRTLNGGRGEGGSRY